MQHLCERTFHCFSSLIGKVWILCAYFLMLLFCLSWCFWWVCTTAYTWNYIKLVADVLLKIKRYKAVFYSTYSVLCFYELIFTAYGSIFYPGGRIYCSESNGWDVQAETLREAREKIYSFCQTKGRRKIKRKRPFWSEALRWSGKFPNFGHFFMSSVEA